MTNEPTTLMDLGEIKGIMFNVQVRNLAHVSEYMHWSTSPTRVIKRDQVVCPTDTERATRRFFEAERVGLSPLVEDLLKAGFVVNSAEGRIRPTQVVGGTGGYGDEWEGETFFQSRVRFILHRGRTLDPDVVADKGVERMLVQYLREHGEPSLVRLSDEAVWSVEGLRNKLRTGDGYGICFNCKARMPYLVMHNRPNMAKRLDPATRLQFGEVVPLVPETVLRLAGNEILATRTKI